MKIKQGFETSAIHAGQVPDPVSLSRGVPITRTSSFVFKSAEHAANLFALKEFGNIYTRLTNPTNAVLEDRVSALEGGAASVTAASGTAAIFNTIVTIAKVGDEIVSASNLYGGTYTLFDAILPDLGINVRFVDSKDPLNFETEITSKTRLLFVETIGNPALDVADIPAISAIAKKHHLPLVVDATFTTPLACDPPQGVTSLGSSSTFKRPCAEPPDGCLCRHPLVTWLLRSELDRMASDCRLNGGARLVLHSRRSELGLPSRHPRAHPKRIWRRCHGQWRQRQRSHR